MSSIVAAQGTNKELNIKCEKEVETYEHYSLEKFLANLKHQS